MKLTAKTRVSVLPATDCRSPLDFFSRVGGRSDVRGAVLMESAAQGEPGGTRSLVVPGAVVRLEVRGSDATYQPLSNSATPVLSALADELDEARMEGDVLRARFPVGPGPSSSSDEERVKAPSGLDAVRALAFLVQDDEPGSTMPAGVYGAFSFELVDRWERLPNRAPDPWNEPDINVVLALDTILYDHLSGETRVVTRALGKGDEEAADRRHRAYLETLKGNGASEDEPLPAGVQEKEGTADTSDEVFLESVRSFLSHIARGDIFQGVLSRGLTMKSDVSTLEVYRALRHSNPSPYMFHVDLGEGALLGASPETSVKVEDGYLEIRPIAGTAPRGFDADGGIDAELDERLAVGLLLDHKEQAEHAMLVDLARNDVARVAVPGTRRVSQPFTIEKYSHVQHLVSGVRGELRHDLDALHAYRAAANMGTLTGAPKLRAMELIRETEPFARGFYGGAVGYLLEDGSFDSCIVIRSLRYGCGTYQTRAGAGIVADSVPESELAETQHKARAPRLAVALAERRCG
jgi:anthranilate synthase component 1